MTYMFDFVYKITRPVANDRTSSEIQAVNKTVIDFFTTVYVCAHILLFLLFTGFIPV